MDNGVQGWVSLAHHILISQPPMWGRMALGQMQIGTSPVACLCHCAARCGNVRRERGGVFKSGTSSLEPSRPQGFSVHRLRVLRQVTPPLSRFIPSASLHGMIRLAPLPTRASTLCRFFVPRQARTRTACAAEADPFNQLFQKRKPTGLRPSYWLNSQDSIQSQLKASSVGLWVPCPMRCDSHLPGTAVCFAWWP